VRFVCFLLAWLLAAGCTDRSGQSETAAIPSVQRAPDPQHANVSGPHGDHTPHHGGLVLMNGDVHYEVVIGRDGKHQVWFSDAVRSELPATVASGVVMEVARPQGPVETVAMSIDEAGESWRGAGRPIAGDGVMVKIRYALQGQMHEIEVPVVSAQALPR
jgi:hypothetical protein